MVWGRTVYPWVLKGVVARGSVLYALRFEGWLQGNEWTIDGQTCGMDTCKANYTFCPANLGHPLVGGNACV